MTNIFKRMAISVLVIGFFLMVAVIVEGKGEISEMPKVSCCCPAWEGLCTMVYTQEECDQRCHASQEEPEDESAEVMNIPGLENFTVSENYYGENDIILVFSPKSNQDYALCMEIARTDDGGQTLWTWCEGDETLCKSIGNGKECGEEDTDTWCYSS